jgi:hypothetical protein
MRLAKKNRPRIKSLLPLCVSQTLTTATSRSTRASCARAGRAVETGFRFFPC